MSNLVGQSVAGYPIEKLLGKGCYSVTFQAATSGAPLAVRAVCEELRGNATANQALAKGWEAARAVTHPNIVTVFSTGVDPQFGAFALAELVAGKPLRQFILDGSKVAWRDCLILAEQLGAAIQALHAAKVCHGDISPSNLLITQDQDLKLEGAGGLTEMPADISDLLDSGALSYQPPECINGSPPYNGSDIYAFGGVVYFVLAGRDPMVSGTGKIAAVSAMRDDLPSVAQEFIGRLLAADPGQRYASINDVMADIGRLKNNAALAPLKTGLVVPPSRVKAAPPPPPSRSHSTAGGYKPGSGMHPVTRGGGSGTHAAISSALNRKTSGFNSVVKDTASMTRVYGRLETHVKSTIPQSDTEKRGDDMYRQAQLPLALNAWREAFESKPHTGLKIKIELAEKEMNKEAYSSAIEESRLRLTSGDYRGAINRAREAIISAETDVQRQQAVMAEERAIEAANLAQQKSRKTTMLVAVVFVAVAAFVLYRIATAPPPPALPDTPPVVDTPPNQPPRPGPQPGPAANNSRVQLAGIATVLRVPGWTQYAQPAEGLTEFRALAPNGRDVLAVGKLMRPGGGQTAKEWYDSLRITKLLESTKTDDVETCFFVDNNYSCSELGFRYKQPDTTYALRFYYILSGPANSVYIWEFNGSEANYDGKVRDGMRRMIQSWSYLSK